MKRSSPAFLRKNVFSHSYELHRLQFTIMGD